MNKEEIVTRLSYLKYLTTDCKDEIAINAAIEEVQKQKTGKWIDVPVGRYICWHKCSNCLQNSIMESKYCPCCGAKMETKKRGINMADIELVIKIPKNYDLLKIQNGSIASKMILNTIANGVPLSAYHFQKQIRRQKIYECPIDAIHNKWSTPSNYKR